MKNTLCKTNINNDFDNILFKLGILDKNSIRLSEDRKIMFQYVCLPVRFLIALFLLYLSEKINNLLLQNTISLLLLFGSIYHLYTKSCKSKVCQWWDNSLEIFMIGITLILTLFGISKNYGTLKIVSLYMILSIFIGQFQNLIIKPFENK